MWSTVLSAWSAQPEFTLNLTLFDRRPLHPQINQILGDFTSLMLLSWHPGESWLHSAQSLQQRLSQNLNHRDVSAIRVMRQLAQRQNVPAVPMPVVFTSALGFEQDNFLARRNLLKPVWGISQTPQVWLDHQIYESEGELRFNWDFVAALFPAGQVERQFEQYCALLNRMAEDESGWQLPLAALVPPVKHAGQCAERSPRVCPEHSQPHIAADESTVSLICDAFREVVGESVTPAENFFEAGATSLNLVQLHVLLQRHEFSTLTLLDLFTHPSPAARPIIWPASPRWRKQNDLALFAVVSGGYSAKQTDFPRNAIANAWRSIDFVNLRKRDRLWITCASLLRRQQIPLMHRSLNTTRTANLSRLSATPAIFLNRRMAKRSGKICWKVVNAADALRAKSFWPSVWMPPSLTILIMSISVRC